MRYSVIVQFLYRVFSRQVQNTFSNQPCCWTEYRGRSGSVLGLGRGRTVGDNQRLFKFYVKHTAVLYRIVSIISISIISILSINISIISILSINISIISISIVSISIISIKYHEQKQFSSLSAYFNATRFYQRWSSSDD